MSKATLTYNQLMFNNNFISKESLQVYLLHSTFYILYCYAKSMKLCFFLVSEFHGPLPLYNYFSQKTIGKSPMLGKFGRLEI